MSYSSIFGTTKVTDVMTLLSMSLGRILAGYAHTRMTLGKAQKGGCQFILCGYPIPMAVEHSVVPPDVLPQGKLAGYTMSKICSD